MILLKAVLSCNYGNRKVIGDFPHLTTCWTPGLHEKQSRAFQIPHAMQDQHGRYRCEISSGTERIWTNEVDVVIGKNTPQSSFT